MTVVSRREFGATAVSAALASVTTMDGASAQVYIPNSAPKPSGALLDPEIAKGLKRGFSGDMAKTLTLAEIQARNPDVVLEERTIPGAAGAPPVPILIITPKTGAARRPGLMNIHGGGYMGGSALQQSAGLIAMVKALGCIGVSVDYRLAPQTRFPGSLDDNHAAFAWFHENAASLQVDPDRIALMGASAGAGHAAMLMLRLREERKYPVLLLYLSQPMLDDRTGTTLDPGPYNGEFIWTREMNRRGWGALLGVEPGSDAVPAGASPGRVENLAGFPPTLISVGSIDLFAQESLAFATRLLRAGVPTQLHLWDGVIHGGTALAPQSRVTKQEAELVIATFRAAFERGPHRNSLG